MPSAAKSILHLTLPGEYRKIPIRCLRKRKEIHPLPQPLLKQVLYHTIYHAKPNLHSVCSTGRTKLWTQPTETLGIIITGQYAVRNKVEETTNKMVSTSARPESNYRKSVVGSSNLVCAAHFTPPPPWKAVIVLIVNNMKIIRGPKSVRGRGETAAQVPGSWWHMPTSNSTTSHPLYLRKKKE